MESRSGLFTILLPASDDVSDDRRLPSTGLALVQ